jgi:hypothetical protein
VLTNVSQNAFDAVTKNQIGNAEYIELGKSVVQDLLIPTLKRFAKLLRDVFGQYWIAEPDEWDSRRAELGHFCSLYSMQWHTNGLSGDFTPTQPTPPTLEFTAEFFDFSSLIKKLDWQTLGKLLSEKFDPPAAAYMASRANRLLREGRIVHSLIESAIALEIAIAQRVELSLPNGHKNSEEAFSKLTRPDQIAIVCGLLRIDETRTKGAIKGVLARNQFVHHGKDPPANVVELIEDMLAVTALIIGEPEIRFTTANTGNLLGQAEDWERRYSKR